MKTPLISVVSPVYKAGHIVEELAERIIASVGAITDDFEIVLVDDNSPDNSWEAIKSVCQKHKFIKGLKLSRNFGQQHATQAGLDASSGEYVVTMDCDLQDRPEEIVNLYQKALEGFDIVIASRKNRKDDFLKILFSKLFNKMLGFLTETNQDSSVANFVLYNRKVVNALAQVHDNHRYYPMLIQWVGFNSAKLPIEHAEREEGVSSYNFKARMQLAFNTILTFSDKPLRLSVKFGIFVSFLALLLAISLIIIHFFSSIQVAGWSSLAVLLTFFSGIIISVLGMVGLYVGKTFESVKDRPTYILQETIN